MLFELKNDIVDLRLFSEKDIDFLKEVYSSTRQEELKQVSDWNEKMKIAFLTQQFEAQHAYYQKNYMGAFFFVIEKEKERIGRLYLDENFGKNDIRIIDIALLPAWRGKGIGQQIISKIIEYAKGSNKKVSIHVESFNPAMALYFRLGFKKVSETNGVYHLLEIEMV